MKEQVSTLVAAISKDLMLSLLEKFEGQQTMSEHFSWTKICQNHE